MTKEIERVRPNGLSVRRMRHERGWSLRDLLDAIGMASERATGIRETITPNLLIGIEEHDATTVVGEPRNPHGRGSAV